MRQVAKALIVNDFILRRTNSLLSAHLPPKVLTSHSVTSTDVEQLVLHVTRGLKLC